MSMPFTINLTKRDRKRKLRSGAAVIQTRYVVNYTEPKTGQRRQEFFERQKEAQARRNELLARVEAGGYYDDRKVPTIGEAIGHWIADKEGKVKASTLAGYKIVVAHLRPLERVKADELTTAEIRSWHREVAKNSGAYTANRAKSHLKAILALAEEDFGVRAPSMPTGLAAVGRSPRKPSSPPSRSACFSRKAAATSSTAFTTLFRFWPALGRASSSDFFGRKSISRTTLSASAAFRSATERSPR
jgi:hypothetical protein